MNKKFYIVIERGKKRVYIGSAVGLYGCRVRAKTPGGLMKNARDAIKRHIKTDGCPDRIDFVGVRLLKIAGRKHSVFTVAMEKDGKYYVANIPSLAGCFTQAKTIEGLIKNIKEVIGICFELKKAFEKTEFVGVGMIEVNI